MCQGIYPSAFNSSCDCSYSDILHTLHDHDHDNHLQDEIYTAPSSCRKQTMTVKKKKDILQQRYGTRSPLSAGSTAPELGISMNAFSASAINAGPPSPAPRMLSATAAAAYHRLFDFAHHHHHQHHHYHKDPSLLDAHPGNSNSGRLNSSNIADPAPYNGAPVKAAAAISAVPRHHVEHDKPTSVETTHLIHAFFFS